mmetsp:Transcript_17561/g.51792  ORF Transcript_17561/g.51792 Transcript_17561/m.51792 type:complete len:222 (-) Transcript_17561:17-682(-)
MASRSRFSRDSFNGGTRRSTGDRSPPWTDALFAAEEGESPTVRKQFEEGIAAATASFTAEAPCGAAEARAEQLTAGPDAGGWVRTAYSCGSSCGRVAVPMFTGCADLASLLLLAALSLVLMARKVQCGEGDADALRPAREMAVHLWDAGDWDWGCEDTFAEPVFRPMHLLAGGACATYLAALVLRGKRAMRVLELFLATYAPYSPRLAREELVAEGGSAAP